MCAKSYVVRECESRITEDHLQIRSMLDRIEAIQDPEILVTLLRELKETLEQHFTLEESEEGLYAIASEYCPRDINKVDKLLAEHWDMLASVDSLIQKCKACIRGPIKEIRFDVKTLHNKIKNHDNAEAEILTEALLKALPTE